jgi:hypothetical protein
MRVEDRRRHILDAAVELGALTRSYFRMLGQGGPLFHEVIVRRLVWGGMEARCR